MFTKLISFFTTVMMFLFPRADIPKAVLEKEAWNTNYTAVFVHGLDGWGEYDAAYRVMPYWGMLGGNLMKYLNARGFDCAAASVSPSASAWDRACELYAQLTGTRVDYGKEHSERCNHARYGTDYSRRPLIDKFDAEHKINLFGHSFGGATVLMFLDLMADGSEAERSVTPENELSPLFAGGKASWVYSVTTLAAPMNGTTAINSGSAQADGAEEEKQEKESLISKATGLLFGTGDDRIAEDSANHDMEIDNAMALLKTFETQPDVYYFSLPACMTKTENGVTTLDTKRTEDVYEGTGIRMCSFTGYTANGYYLDESWQPNDGLVNTISARAPFDAPQKDLDPDNIEKGVWNVYPVYEGDHMSLQGGLLVNNNIRGLYTDMLNTINKQ